MGHIRVCHLALDQCQVPVCERPILSPLAQSRMTCARAGAIWGKLHLLLALAVRLLGRRVAGHARSGASEPQNSHAQAQPWCVWLLSLCFELPMLLPSLALCGRTQIRCCELAGVVEIDPTYAWSMQVLYSSDTHFPCFCCGTLASVAIPWPVCSAGGCLRTL